MTIWEAIDLAKQGQPVRHPAMADGDSIVYDAGIGNVRAVAVKVTEAGVRTVVQSADIGSAEWARTDWEVLS